MFFNGGHDGILDTKFEPFGGVYYFVRNLVLSFKF